MPGSNDIADCTCNPGFSGLDGGTCTACPAGKHKATAGPAACTDCEAGKYSDAGEAVECTKCGAGKYSSSTGGTSEGSCSKCPSGTYSEAEGAQNSLSCTQCGSGLDSPAGSDSSADCACSQPGVEGSACQEETVAPRAPLTSKFFVTLLVAMPYTSADFGIVKRDAFVEAVAATAKTNVANVEIVSVTEKQRRAASVDVETKIRATDSNGLNDLSAQLGSDDDLKSRLNKELKGKGLVEATGVTQSAGSSMIEDDAATTDQTQSQTTSGSSGVPMAAIIGGVVGFLVLVLAAWWCFCRSKRRDPKTGPKDVEMAGADTSASAQAQVGTFSSMPMATAHDVASLLLPEAAEGMKESLLQSTFLSGMGGTAMGALLRAGKCAPIVGKVFGLLADIKEQVDIWVETEEESKRMSVWCVSLMAVLGRLSQETQGDPTTESLLYKAAGDLRKVLDLIKTRNKTGVLAKAASLWTAREFKEKMATASDSVEKAIQALSLSVSAQTKHDVNQVLSKVDLLPRMDEKLNALNDKMDEVFRDPIFIFVLSYG